MLAMRRAPRVGAEAPALDVVQQRVVTGGEDVLLLGAPGTGKSTTAVECVATAVTRGLPADRCLLLAPTRLQAALLRDRVTGRLRGTNTAPLARSHQALGFSVLRQAAALRGDAPPRLLSGPEQDVVLRELLEGHRAHEGKAPDWPAFMREALDTKGFRGQLRDLLMRAVEWGLTADELRDLGVRHQRPEWVAAATVLQEYDEVTALSRPGAYDPAWILQAAADLLQTDGAARQRLHSSVELVVVDDAQELTMAGARLLRLVVGPACRLVLIGNPDQVVQGFRGADPGMMFALARDRRDDPGRGRLRREVLPLSHGVPRAVADVVQQVAGRIGVAGTGEHRRPQAEAGGSVTVALLRAVAQEAAYIARALREAHLLESVPWQQMTVIVRDQARSSALRRLLAGAGVPAAVPPTSLPLRDEPVVRPLLQLFEVALGLAQDPQYRPDAEVAQDVLTSPFGGADAVAMRRMRRELRRHELATGGSRAGDELLRDAVVDAAPLTLLGPQVAPARRVCAVVDAGVQALRREHADAESALWAMWQASGLASGWRETALAGGPAGARADRNLDAVVALFSAAAAYADRLPGAGPRAFVEHLQSQDVPGDRLTDAAPLDECVALHTPQSAAGGRWQLVVVAGVQEGVWPNLRLRGSLLGSEDLVDVLAGRGDDLRAAQAAVRYDETRQFLQAVSRSSDRLVVTAVRSEDEQPSPYLDLVDPLDDAGAAQDEGADRLREFAVVRPPLTLAGLVAGCRQALVSDPAAGTADADRPSPSAAAGILARLAGEHVRGADPAGWWGLTDLSDTRPLREPDQQVTVSPSRVEAFQTCGLNWLLTSCGGTAGGMRAAGIGTLVHEIAAELADEHPERMHAALDERWPRLGLGSGWVGERARSEAHGMLDRLLTYLDQARSAGWQSAGVEVEFRVDVGRARLTGRVDRLERRGTGSVRVIDLKTGSSKPTAEQLPSNAQLGAYQVAVQAGAFEAAHTSDGAILVQLGKAGHTGGKPAVQAQGALREQADPAWAEKLVTDTAEGMAQAVVTATSGPRCQTCPVRSCCPLQPEGARL